MKNIIMLGQVSQKSGGKCVNYVFSEIKIELKVLDFNDDN